jgi:branched-chain amino acid transport system permease protein
MIFIVVIGGIGTIEGPIIGTILYFFIRQYLFDSPLIRQYLSDSGEWGFILLGAIAVIMMLLAPQGIWGMLHTRFGWQVFPAHRLLPSRAQPDAQATATADEVFSVMRDISVCAARR